MQTEALVSALFLLFVIQVIGTHLQVKEYKRAVRELHKRGNVGIGSRRRKLGPSNIVVIACNSCGEILEGRIRRSTRRCPRSGVCITRAICRRSMP